MAELLLGLNPHPDKIISRGPGNIVPLHYDTTIGSVRHKNRSQIRGRHRHQEPGLGRGNNRGLPDTFCQLIGADKNVTGGRPAFGRFNQHPDAALRITAGNALLRDQSPLGTHLVAKRAVHSGQYWERLPHGGLGR